MKKFSLIITFLIVSACACFSQWTQQELNTNSTLTSVHFLNEDEGFITSIGGIYKTTNGGENWDLVYTDNGLDTPFLEDVFIVDKNTIIAVGFTTDLSFDYPLVLKSDDFGQTWTDISVAGNNKLNSTFFINSQKGYICGEGGKILVTEDGGQTWTDQLSNTGSVLKSIFFVNNQVGLAIGGFVNNAVILKTQNGGLTWNEIENPSTEFLQSVYFTSEQIGYVVGWNGEILKTEDCGSSWSQYSVVNMVGYLEIFFTDEQTGYIVGGQSTEKSILKTTNAGLTWENIGPDTEVALSGMHFPSNNIGYAVGGFGVVLKTETAGDIVTTENFYNNKNVQLYPNPSNSILNLKSEINIESIRMIDINGNTVLQKICKNENLSLDVSSFHSGLYFLEITTKNGKSMKNFFKEHSE